MDRRRVLWLLSHPRDAVKGVAGWARYLGYPWHKTYVGPPNLYDELGLYQFELLRSAGLEPSHSLLDVGCGSLRAGRFFIRYLNPENYIGIEPNSQLLRRGIRHNLDKATLRQKRPKFSDDGEFNLSALGRRFDFILAHSILTHAARHQIKKCFLEARQVMSPKSLFFGNYNKGESDYAGKEWVYPSHVTYTPKCISTLAQEAGLRCSELDVEHPTDSSWVLIYDAINTPRLPNLIRGQELGDTISSAHDLARGCNAD